LIDYNKYDDDKLIELLRTDINAHSNAFNVLYFRYSERLHSYCMFKSDNIDDAKELFQETWIKFYYSLNNSNKHIPLPAYIYVIARNLSINKYREKKRKNINNFEITDLENIAAPINVHASLEQKELLSIINIAVNSLGDLYKEIFILRWFSGLSYNEIAEIVNESSDCVRQRSSRAMEKVLKILKPIIIELDK
jgi:RNA polymerase sigma factor (sigma-70 family)